MRAPVRRAAARRRRAHADSGAPFAEADALEHLGRQRTRIDPPLQLERQHHVLERIQVGQQLEALENEADLAARTAARVFADREQVDAVEPHRPRLGVSSPAISESKVLLPEPDAPTIATERWRGNVKSISWRIVRVPVESCTRLVSRSTAMMGSDMSARLDARESFEGASEASVLT